MDNDELPFRSLIEFIAKLHAIAFNGTLHVEFTDGETDSEATSVSSPNLTRKELSSLLRELEA